MIVTGEPALGLVFREQHTTGREAKFLPLHLRTLQWGEGPSSTSAVAETAAPSRGGSVWYPGRGLEQAKGKKMMGDQKTDCVCLMHTQGTPLGILEISICIMGWG